MMDRKGVTRTVDNGLFWDHSVAPDGKRAAVSVVTRGTGLMDIWIYDLARGTRDRFTSDPAIEVSPAWAPDGRSIVYAQAEGGSFPHLVRRGLTDAVSEDLTARGPFQFSASFSHDGQSLFYQSDSGKGSDIFRLALGSKKSEPAVATGFMEATPVVSPDGAWLAYSSNATGVHEVYLQSLGAGDAVRIRVSNSGGHDPQWRADGKELFYVGGSNAVMSATPGADGRWDDATLVELFRVPGNLQAFAAAPNGQSFLLSDRQAGAADELFHVMTGVR